jgi:hypothetical protein
LALIEGGALSGFDCACRILVGNLERKTPLGDATIRATTTTITIIIIIIIICGSKTQYK